MKPVFTLPHDPLTKLESTTRPTPRAIRLFRKEVYANLCSVPTQLGGGDHGHLGMVMPNVDYILISTGGADYAPPAGAPPVPEYVGTAAHVAVQQGTYQREMQEFDDYQAIKAHMKAIMLQAVPKTYTSALAHPQLGYASTTPQAIMNHLLTRYGAIQEKDLADNMALLSAPWNPDDPIETVFDNGTFCRDYASEGLDPISDPTYIRLLVQVFD